MNFTNFLLSMLIVSTACAADETPRSTLRGLGAADTMVYYEGFLIQVGATINPKTCTNSVPDTGDHCSEYNKQCLYQINGVTNGEILEPSYWGCNCDHRVDEYVCHVRCGAHECIGTKAPTAAPIKGVRGGVITQPPNYSWCPTVHPGHHQSCKYVGVECSYSSGSVVEKCECDIVSYGAGRENWDYLWICDHDPDYM